MDKIIKEFKEDEFTYRLGYYLIDNKVYPIIEIFKNNKLLSGGDWNGVSNNSLSGIFTVYSDFDYGCDISTIKEMFTELRKYSKVPEKIEKEYENLFIIYKLNDFNEI